MNVKEHPTKSPEIRVEGAESPTQTEAEQSLSRLTLPQVDKAAHLASYMAPATGVRSVILNLLSRLPGRTLSPDTLQEDKHFLVSVLTNLRDTAVYGSLLIVPAAIIWVYQNILKLTGMTPEDAFPDGTWQFYVEYALREDAARHSVETHGFDTTFAQYQIHLSQLDRMTAWVMTAVHMLFEYDDLLKNEWRERVYISVLHELMAENEEPDRFATLYRDWEKQRPYSRTAAQIGETYSMYRQTQFDRFLESALQELPVDLRREWVARVREKEEDQLAAYQKQLSILAHLEPGEYGETRTAFPLSQTHVGIIYQGQYYLLSVCEPGSTKPVLVQTIRRQIASILNQELDLPPVQLKGLASIHRAAWSSLRAQLNPELVGSLLLLRTAPILFNFDKRSRHWHLSKLRQAERGIGDHAITIFDTGETFVFDLSHIFFDGTWGVSMAEIMTNEASSWAAYLRTQPRLQPGSPLYDDDDDDFLPLNIKSEDWAIIERQPRIKAEASAETAAINLRAIRFLRNFFKQRSDLLSLTVNDILVLYRAIHAVTYKPDPEIVAVLKALTREEATREAAYLTLEMIQSHRHANPNILIPLDASRRSPRDRLHPMTFSVPFEALDLPNLHQQCVASLEQHYRGLETFATFDEKRHQYLGALAGFGELFSRAKDIAAVGGSASVGSIKLLAHLPKPIQRLLDKIPNRFEVLNDIIKGREVFSNVGAVVPGSTLTRFMTAKDDNENKTLAWGVITDADANMHITLRDFRPYVALLVGAGYHKLANRIIQDYLDAYARGLNDFISSLLQITLANDLQADRENNK